jgi:hypothetical protein
MPYNNFYNNRYQKQQPDWDKINGQKKLDIIKGQTANQLIQILIATTTYTGFEDFLKCYEKAFPLLLEVNKRLLIGEGDENARV